MLRSLLSLSLVVVCPLPAQIEFPLYDADICNANRAVFSQTFFPSGPTNIVGVGNANFGATAACNPDVLYTHAPMFRFDGDTELTAFWDSGVPGDQALFAYDSAGIHVTWGDVDNRGSLRAAWCANVHCCGATGGIVDHVWRFTNIGLGGPGFGDLDFTFLVYTDMDLSQLNDSVGGASSGGRHLVRDVTGCPNEVVEFWGGSPTSWEVDAFASFVVELAADPFAGLSGTGIPFAGDYAGAMAWDLTVPAGHSVEVRYSFGVNCMQCDTLAGVSTTGVSPAVLSTTSLGSLGSPVDLSLVGGPSSVAGSLLWGLPSPSVPLSPVFPTCVAEVLHVSATISTLPISTDASGVGGTVFPGLFGPHLCGVTLEFQYAALVLHAFCPFALSNELAVTYGRPVPVVGCGE